MGKDLQSDASREHAPGVEESMESARRWSGFVCPDCRFVFRVPRDHDGRGIVCPCCRRMLKIPAGGDATPPLIVPLRRMQPEARPAGDDSASMKRRMRHRKHGEVAAHHSWEQKREGWGGRRGERRQMRLMLVGGGLLLALIIAGTMISMHSSNGVPPVVEKTGRPQVVPPADASVATPSVPSDTAFLTEAEPLARRFLAATTVDEMSAMVRNPDITIPRMKAFYPDGNVMPVGTAAFNVGAQVTRQGSSSMVVVRTLAQEEKSIVFVKSAGGLRIDWESWVGWSEIPWPEFISKRPTQPHVFRLTLSEGDYYNFNFSDDSKWHSYRLESPDRETRIFGYAERGSGLEAGLNLDMEGKGLTFMLVLKYPDGASRGNQVEIMKIIGKGWVEEDKP